MFNKNRKTILIFSWLLLDLLLGISSKVGLEESAISYFNGGLIFLGFYIKLKKQAGQFLQ